MLSRTEVVLGAAIVLSAAFPASAATKHHRVTHISPMIYNVVPNNISVSTACLPSDSPCRTQPDSW